MAMNPLFTVTFDLKSSGSYGSFIDDLRQRFGRRGHFSHNHPVLPPYDETVPPRWWFHAVLRTQTSSLTLAIRADNLYLEGFQSSDGTWWELTQGFIPGATYVGFGGSYSDLLGQTDAMVRVELGPQQMTEAVNVLAGRRRADKSSEAKQKQAGKMLATLLLMVNEATRFVTVSAFVAGLMHPKVIAATKSGVITPRMKEQVNGWGDLSAALLRTDARPPAGFVGEKGGLTAAKAEKMGVDTEEKAANTVGVVLFAEDKTVKGMMTGAKALQLFPVGRLAQ